MMLSSRYPERKQEALREKDRKRVKSESLDASTKEENCTSHILHFTFHPMDKQESDYAYLMKLVQFRIFMLYEPYFSPIQSH